MNEFEARQYVAKFVGDDLMQGVDRRTADGQLPGMAVCNTGDHADRVWAWAPGWEQLLEAATWVKVAEWLKAWGSSE